MKLNDLKNIFILPITLPLDSLDKGIFRISIINFLLFLIVLMANFRILFIGTFDELTLFELLKRFFIGISQILIIVYPIYGVFLYDNYYDFCKDYKLVDKFENKKKNFIRILLKMFNYIVIIFFVISFFALIDFIMKKLLNI